MVVAKTLRFVPLVTTFVIIFISTAITHGHAASITPRKVYLVFLDSQIIPSTKPAHLDLLKTVLQDITPEESLVYDYHSTSGFAAKLSETEAKHLASIKGVVSVFPNQVAHLDHP
ncbi:unnamed protein product [Linum tenue]|uniref:Inhibitor I9 domain-containing protein n=1 Tax=Linum tenue TaxID=586396 RepID=A0AAV0MAV2_9ROSI|nr:unnamed protein product [Linum tenue]